MSIEISEKEKRRAQNLIWNAALDYSFQPMLCAYDQGGRAERYWNSVIGLVYHRFNRCRTEALFESFEGTVGQLQFENLLWLALEHSVFEGEKQSRPALILLRQSYARQMIADNGLNSELLHKRIACAHFMLAVGLPPRLAPNELALLCELQYPDVITDDELAERTIAIFTKYLGFVPAEGKSSAAQKGGLKPFRLPDFFGVHKGDQSLAAVRGFAFGFGEHSSRTEIYDDEKSMLRISLNRAHTGKAMLDYIANYFGAPLCSNEELAKLQKEYCTGSHRLCRLYLTRGAYTDKSLAAGYAGAQKRASLKQAKRNRAYYHEHEAQNRSSIERLARRIQNCLLANLDTLPQKTAAGVLDGGKIWRSLYCDDNKIFSREIRGSLGSLSVDILLDASSSQINRQAQVASQGYIIAEGLTRCNLPVRVWSFCSLSGFTVLNLFRNYNESGFNKNIFNYFTGGCNRDGLAIRLVSGLMQKEYCEHKVLIILSDAKPNDVLKTLSPDGKHLDYTEQTGVDDTAAEVHRARLIGHSVICVFTGEDASLPAVERIYGRDFSRIRSLNQFADTVSNLIEQQIKNL